MPRVKCPRCSRAETVLKAGFVRDAQRYLCKECDYHFTLTRAGKNRLSRNKSHQTTIVDIAKAVGVSVSTVSRALRNQDDIKTQTRLDIQKAAVELDYQPNLIAKSLHTRETQTIGIIVPEIANPFFASVLSGTQHAASAAGYNLMICQSDESLLTEVSNVQTLIANRVDGLLICHTKETQSFDHIRLQLKKGVPIIHFDRVAEDLPTPKVVLDDVNGAKEVTAHLLQQGAKRIAIIAGPAHLSITRRRLNGYLEALQDAGIDPDKDLQVFTDFTKDAVHAGIQRLLDLNDQPDGIFCISDSLAIPAMLFLKQKKVLIPEQIRVAGFGNDYTGQIIEPGLTSFDPHPFRMGEATMRLFIEQIIHDTPPPPETITISGELIVRASS